MRRYWRDVRAGRRYRRGYTERHFTKRGTPRKAAKKPKATTARKARRKPPVRRTPPRRPAAPPVIPYRQYEARFPGVKEWHPNPVLEFGLGWVAPTLRYGMTGKRRPVLPRRAVLPSRKLIVYFLVRSYKRGEQMRHVVGWAVDDAAMLERWRPWTLARWWKFVMTDVWQFIQAAVDERNSREGTDWQIGGKAAKVIVLWHFVKEAH